MIRRAWWWGGAWICRGMSWILRRGPLGVPPDRAWAGRAVVGEEGRGVVSGRIGQCRAAMFALDPPSTPFSPPALREGGVAGAGGGLAP
eukprot:5861033-Pyramimonas_sp.AAC.1